MSTPALAGSASPAVRLRGQRYPVLLPSLRDPRLHLAAVIVSLQVLGQTAFAFDLSIAQILVSILTCAAIEVAVTFRRRRVLMWPASALLTGNGVAFVLRVPGTEHGDWWSLNGAWIFAATAAVGLGSKYVIRYRGRHLFNPSNFGLVLCFLALGSDRVEPLDFWWGPMTVWLALALAIIVVGGLVILSRLRMLGIAAGFWIAFAAGVGVLGASGHSTTARWHLGPVSDGYFWWVLVTSPEILVFLFFMLTDPKTAPLGRVARLVYAVSVALVATLLIAPQTTEFGAKVAVLGALTLVCAARPLLERLLPAPDSERDRLSVAAARLFGGGGGRRLGVTAGLAIGAAAVLASLIVAAGVPARSGETAPRAALPEPTGDLPAVKVAPSPGVASGLDRATARAMARDVVADLRLQADALRRQDLLGAAAGAGGAWLRQLQDRIRTARRGLPGEVPVYALRQILVKLVPGEGQAAPSVLATLEGTVVTESYGGSPPRLEGRSVPARVRQTFRIASTRGRYAIVGFVSGQPSPDGAGAAARTVEISLRSASGARAAPLGRPFTVRVFLRNRARATAPIDYELGVAPLGGVPVTVYRGRDLVSGHGTLARVVSVNPAQLFASPGRYQITASAGGQSAAAPLALDVTGPQVPVPRFEDVTRVAGLETTVPAPACGQFMSGAAWGDVNGDGVPDLFLTRLGKPAQLFVGDGHGRFREEAVSRGVAVTGATAAAFADYDNDGHQDLYVARAGSDVLFHNDGNGHFTDVTRAAGIADDAPDASVTFADYDGDGRLDLYVASYVSCVGKWTTPYTLESKVRYYPDRLYHNDGHGRFTDVSSLLGRAATNGAGLAAAWLDVNGDGRSDLFLGNDFIGGDPDHNHLWRNDGRGTRAWRFTDVSAESRTALYANTMGIALGDFNRDLRPDLALSNIGAANLLRNNGNGTFTDVASAAGVARTFQRAGVEAITWGLGLYDFNLDGWDDLYLAAGNIVRRGSSRPQPNELFVNDGTGRRFLDLSAPSGADDPGDSKGAAFADYDGDGRMDILVVDQGGGPHLYRNVTPPGRNHWLEVKTVGTVSNRDGCGARLVLTLAGGSRLGGQVLCSGSQEAVHFGLGEAARVAKLDVLWPSGSRQVLRDVPVDRLLTVRESGRRPVSIP